MKWLLLLVMSGCSTEAYWVKKSYEPRGGIIGYRTSGLMASERMENAKAKMIEFCGDEKFKVMSTENREVSSGSTTTYNSFTHQYYSRDNSSDHEYVIFKCVPNRQITSEPDKQ